MDSPKPNAPLPRFEQRKLAMTGMVNALSDALSGREGTYMALPDRPRTPLAPARLRITTPISGQPGRYVAVVVTENVNPIESGPLLSSDFGETSNNGNLVRFWNLAEVDLDADVSPMLDVGAAAAGFRHGSVTGENSYDIDLYIGIGIQSERCA